MRLSARRALVAGELRGPMEVMVDDGLVTALTPGGDGRFDLLCPGFVDLQCNGAGDVAVLGARGEADWASLGRWQAAHGATTWFPTITTSPDDAMAAALSEVAAASAATRGRLPAIGGAHLEGPMLGDRPGAHPPGLVRALGPDRIASLPEHVRIVTVGPEAPGAIAAVSALAARGITVALGHTAADDATLDRAVDAGATLVTHVFNAMAGFHHRAPGAAGWALTTDAVAVTVVADGHHVAPRALELVFRAKPRGSVALLSDAVAWRLGGSTEAGDGPVRLPDGTLAGSTIGLSDAVAVATAAGVPLADALAAASEVPARLVGLDDRGRIEVGLRADLVALSIRPVPTVEAVWCGGRQIVGGRGR